MTVQLFSKSGATHLNISIGHRRTSYGLCHDHVMSRCQQSVCGSYWHCERIMTVWRGVIALLRRITNWQKLQNRMMGNFVSIIGLGLFQRSLRVYSDHFRSHYNVCMFTEPYIFMLITVLTRYLAHIAYKCISRILVCCPKHPLLSVSRL